MLLCSSPRMSIFSSVMKTATLSNWSLRVTVYSLRCLNLISTLSSLRDTSANVLSWRSPSNKLYYLTRTESRSDRTSDRNTFSLIWIKRTNGFLSWMVWLGGGVIIIKCEIHVGCGLKPPKRYLCFCNKKFIFQINSSVSVIVLVISGCFRSTQNRIRDCLQQFSCNNEKHKITKITKKDSVLHLKV